MKTYVFFIAVFLNALLLFAAQERSTTGMKIILVVDANSNSVTSITPLDTFQKMMVSDVFEKYPGCHFYMGSLKGNYDLIDTNIIPAENAIITMYTEREFFRFGKFISSKTLDVGDDFSLGKVVSKITSIKKGELLLETKGHNSSIKD